MGGAVLLRGHPHGAALFADEDFIALMLVRVAGNVSGRDPRSRRAWWDKKNPDIFLLT